MDFKQKYLKYKQKYIALKAQSNFVQSDSFKQKYIDLKTNMSGGGFNIFLRYMDKIIEVTVNSEDIISDIINLFTKETGIEGEFKIIYKGKELEYERKVTDYNINKNDTLIIADKIRKKPVVPNVHLLDYLFRKLATEYTEGQQIIISTMCANQRTHQGNELDISQQIKFHRINPTATEIIIILYDAIFFTYEVNQDQLYSLVNLIQEPLEDLPNQSDSELIKKYVKPIDTLFVINESNPTKEIYRKYFTKYNSDHSRINKKFSWYIIKYVSTSDLNEFTYLMKKYTMTDRIELLGYAD